MSFQFPITISVENVGSKWIKQAVITGPVSSREKSEEKKKESEGEWTGRRYGTETALFHCGRSVTSPHRLTALSYCLCVCECVCVRVSVCVSVYNSIQICLWSLMCPRRSQHMCLCAHRIFMSVLSCWSDIFLVCSVSPTVSLLNGAKALWLTKPELNRQKINNCYWDNYHQEHFNLRFIIWLHQGHEAT